MKPILQVFPCVKTSSYQDSQAAQAEPPGSCVPWTGPGFWCRSATEYLAMPLVKVWKWKALPTGCHLSLELWMVWKQKWQLVDITRVASLATCEFPFPKCAEALTGETPPMLGCTCRGLPSHPTFQSVEWNQSQCCSVSNCICLPLAFV